MGVRRKALNVGLHSLHRLHGREKAGLPQEQPAAAAQNYGGQQGKQGGMSFHF